MLLFITYDDKNFQKKGAFILVALKKNLTINFECGIVNKKRGCVSRFKEYAAVAQSVERILGKDEVGGSNPPSSSTFMR